MSVVYGPVPSWRLGRSLGIYAVSSLHKTCSSDCLHSQPWLTTRPLCERRIFVSAQALRSELVEMEGLNIDFVTFSGIAEPTLAANLRKLVAAVKETLPGAPVAILTNSSLMPRTDVRLDLSFFDIVVAKIDAPNEELFTRINRPFIDYTLDGILQGIRISRERARSKLALQMMFIEAKQDKAQEMAESARCLQPDEVQLNAPCGPVRCHPKSFRHEGDRGCLRRFERGPGLQKRATSAGPCGRS